MIELLLRKLYTFLFLKHDIGFMRLCYAMLIPCAFSETFCSAWMLFMSFILAVVIQANHKGWNRRVNNV